MTPENPLFEHQMPESILGATQLLEELAVQFDILDRTMALDGYRLVILPDDFKCDAEFDKKLAEFVAGGGKVLACDQGGLTDQGDYVACLGAHYLGRNEVYPDFIVPEGTLADGLDADAEYAIYMQGARIEPHSATTALTARAPYFRRQRDMFCSHQYTPSAHGAAYPCAVKTDAGVLFAHPMFSQYRDNAPRWVKLLIANAIDMLMPRPLVRHDGPSTLRVSLLDQPDKQRTCVHVLSYVPVRKSATIDIIEERTQARDVALTLNIPRNFTHARLVPENVELNVVRTETGAQIKLPCIDGYAIVELS